MSDPSTDQHQTDEGSVFDRIEPQSSTLGLMGTNPKDPHQMLAISLTASWTAECDTDTVMSAVIGLITEWLDDIAVKVGIDPATLRSDEEATA